MSNASQNLSPLAMLVIATGMFIAIWSNDRPAVVVAQPVPSIQQPYNPSGIDRTPLADLDDVMSLDDSPLLSSQNCMPAWTSKLVVPCNAVTWSPIAITPIEMSVLTFLPEETFTPDELVMSTASAIPTVREITVENSVVQTDPFGSALPTLGGTSDYEQQVSLADTASLRCFADGGTDTRELDRVALGELQSIR